jgi:hypothetical protein
MVELRDELRVVLKDWDVRLAHRTPGQRADLLESLNAGNNGKPGNRRQAPQISFRQRKREMKSK